MARLASQAKMLYYPTPESVLGLIKNMIKVEDDAQYAAIDPCCGTGEFARAMPDGVRTYGNELNKMRYQQAKANLDETIYGDGLWDVKATNMAFSCLWLNPPYDWSRNLKGQSERMELQFLKAATKYLAYKGLLIFIIPINSLYHCAEYLAFNYKDIEMFRFPEEHYDDFKQIVVFGRRAQGKNEQVAKDLIGVSVYSPWRESPPIKKLDEAPAGTVYTLLPSKEIKTFKSTKINEFDLELAARASDLNIESIYKPEDTTSIRVPMPLHKGHLAMLLASGYMNGEFKNKDQWYLVKGATKKSVQQIQTEDGFKEKDKIEIVLKALDLNNNQFIDIK